MTGLDGACEIRLYKSFLFLSCVMTLSISFFVIVGVMFGMIDADPTFEKDSNAIRYVHACCMNVREFDCTSFAHRGNYCYYEVTIGILPDELLMHGVDSVVNCSQYMNVTLVSKNKMRPLEVLQDEERHNHSVLCYSNLNQSSISIVDRYSQYYNTLLEVGVTFAAVGGFLTICGILFTIVACYWLYKFNHKESFS